METIPCAVGTAGGLVFSQRLPWLGLQIAVPDMQNLISLPEALSSINAAVCKSHTLKESMRPH